MVGSPSNPSTPAERPADWDPAAVDDPHQLHQLFDETRERCPVAWSDDWGGYWSLLRYDDVVAAARDHRTFSSAQEGIWLNDRLGVRPRQPPLHSDRPEHTDYRRILNPFFTPAAVSARADRTRAIARSLVGEVAGVDECDLYRRFTRPYPAMVLCDLFGLPSTAAEAIKLLSEGIGQAYAAEDAAALQAVDEAFDRFLTELIDDRRSTALDPETDPVSGLLAGQVDGEPVSDALAKRVLLILFRAGHATTTHGLGSAIVHLARQPADQERLRAEPETIPAAIEEVLRCWTPTRALPRRALGDTSIGGTDISSGQGVGLFWSAANRDPEAFADAGTCDLTRSPNPHVAFGMGIHRCLGVHLAREELRIGLEELLSSTRRFTLTAEPSYARFPQFGPQSIPVAIDWAG